MQGEQTSSLSWRKSLVAETKTWSQGLREDFDHLEKRLFIVQSEESVVFVEETDLVSHLLSPLSSRPLTELLAQSAKSLCSGYCAVLSLPGEVYAWLGEGSTSIERESCCQFAESIAVSMEVSLSRSSLTDSILPCLQDGRSVNVLAEGEETQWFWHSLDDEDNVEYASANVSAHPPCSDYPIR